MSEIKKDDDSEDLILLKDTDKVLIVNNTVKNHPYMNEIIEEINFADLENLQDTEIISLSCTAGLFKETQIWDDSSLEIKWDSEQREFAVNFSGKGKLNINIENLLSKKVPLHIAKSSNCECGEPLALGNYNVTTTNNDFKFEGTFFCPKCKKRFFSERAGLRHIISKWIKGLKKFEIKATGVGIERE